MNHIQNYKLYIHNALSKTGFDLCLVNWVVGLSQGTALQLIQYLTVSLNIDEMLFKTAFPLINSEFS